MEAPARHLAGDASPGVQSMISNYYKVLIALICLVYFINPMDLVPDYFPLLGWLDDSLLIGLLIYYLKTGKLPGFFRFDRFREDGMNDNGENSRDGSEQSRNNDHSARQKKSRSTRNRRANSTTGARGKTPHETLGLPPGAGLDKIRAAYRKAAAMYHPDKVSHLGPEFQEMARVKFIEIQRAYEELTGK